MTIPSVTPLAAIARTDTDFVAKIDALFSTLLSLFVTEENAAIAATNIATADVTAKQLLAAAAALAAQADRILTTAAAAAVAAQSPVTNAAAAAASALAAQGYATLAQATNPDAPVRLNPRRITTALNIASGYNAESVGPITIAEGITVTVSDNATWSVN